MKTLLPLLFALCAFAAETSWDLHTRQGRLLQMNGRYQDAAREFEAALADAGKPNDGDLRLPLTLHNLGAVYRKLGRYDDAERCYRRAIAIFDAAQPRWNQELAVTLENLGGLNLEMGRPSRAEPFFRRAAELAGDACLVCVNGLASAAQQLRRYTEALELYRRAAALADSPLSAAIVQHNLALLYRDLHRDAEARPLLEEAVSVYERVAPSNPKLAIALRNLADLEAASGSAARAGQLYERSLAICEASLPADHPQTGIILQAYAQFLAHTGRKKDARAVAARSRAILGRANTVDASAFAGK